MMAVEHAVETLYDRVRARYLGPDVVQQFGDKLIAVSWKPEHTLQAIYAEAAQEERARPSLDVMNSLARIANGYLEASAAGIKARTVAMVDKFLRDAESKGKEVDLEAVLRGQLNEVWGSATTGLKKILDTEATHARNLGSIEGIIKVAASYGIDDPVVYFVTVRDKSRCEECTRLHLLADKKTPRLWLMSEVGAGYHRRGDPNPKIGGLHPACRCSIATLAPGYGFDAGGSPTFLGFKWDEFKIQRGQKEKE